MKVLPECVALLGDLVASRTTDRSHVHAALLRGIDETNARVPALDALRVTVGDEVQGLYASVGDALGASVALRNALFGTADMRFGIGGGDVRIIDDERGIQDGSAWWLARDAINAAEALAGQAGYTGVRTAVRDQRQAAVAAADGMVRLVDVSVDALRDGARRSLIGLLNGLENAEVARLEGITESANSQRVIHNSLRVLADAITAVQLLP
ncbi:SatD family protein [Tessaracoccus antarcticus]|uniref:RNA polymerase subunit sigma-70 n=1 Tax=Tessaracoccus antarcticus TaxID=2479848 RepID=A0A3M0G7W3_9ACTN|nr:SatD family protein [Tessaracoccus antarcticus]RMB61120.1 RNA polymerase subunit sigma-70 [Tessaracoccus antarcticus]